METKLQSKQQYPRFIQNKPCGIDKFDGGSQERLAKTIARHFCQNDSLDEECTLPRIIGIEGIWGSGKSNVVKMLERELSDDYYFFEYDAWGHQEDLQRRSILELLTSKLIDDGILSGNATIKVKGGGTKTVSWSEKLKYLLARKTETVTEKYPLISNGMVAAFFCCSFNSDIYIYCVCSKTYTHNMVVFFIVYYHSCTASSYCIVRLEMGI